MSTDKTAASRFRREWVFLSLLSVFGLYVLMVDLPEPIHY